jgi:hypothetical protein
MNSSIEHDGADRIVHDGVKDGLEERCGMLRRVIMHDAGTSRFDQRDFRELAKLDWKG